MKSCLKFLVIFTIYILVINAVFILNTLAWVALFKYVLIDSGYLAS